MWIAASTSSSFFLPIQELRIEIIFRSVGAGVHSTLGVFKSRRSSPSEPEAWSIQTPLCFYSACSIQDRAIKEHSGCQLDEFFFLASLWQVRICSVAEKIGLNRIPIFPRMSVLRRVLCCPHKALESQQCRQSAIQCFLNIMLHVCRIATHNSSIVEPIYLQLSNNQMFDQAVDIAAVYLQKHVFSGKNGSAPLLFEHQLEV